MKNKFLFVLSCAILLLASITAKAVPAYPGLIDFKQPNGQIVKIYIHGDEFLHWASTEDGYTLLYDAEGYLAYAEKEAVTGKLVPSKMRPSSPDASGRRRAPERNFLEGIEKGLWFSDEQVSMARQAVNAFNQGIKKSPAKARWKEPVTGEKRFVMLLVEFQDVHFTHTKEEFEALMNQLNYYDKKTFGSVRDFYRENSFGKLDLMTDVFGVYRISKDMAYYGASSDAANDQNPLMMFKEAVQLADPEIDFSKYDNDGDGIVDGIHIIYAGFGEEAGGGKDCIWAHSMSFGMGTRYDGKEFTRYSCSPELRGNAGNSMTYIGVICHEIGHVLGTLDFYDTNYNYGGSYPGNGYYDLMSSGSWNGGGVCPAHFNPYSKIYDFRWAEPMDGNSAQTLTLKAKNENSIVRIDTKVPDEYYLLEYRSQKGFDSCIPGHGLVIYHAAEDLETYTSTWWNSINATHRQRFYIVSANAPEAIPTKTPSSYGFLNNTAPFPGRNHIEEFTDFTIPSMRSWYGTTTDFPITSIEEDTENESITFDIAGGKDGGAAGLKVIDSDLSSISLSWKKKDEQKVLLAYSKSNGKGNPESEKDYSVGDIITDCGEVIYCGAENEYVHTGLEEAETYYYRLYTKKEDGSWTAARTTSGKTQVGVIRKFPFVEDFNSGKLDDAWKLESLISTRMYWKVENEDTQNLQTAFEADQYGSESPRGKERCRLILPQIDFTDVKNAYICIDYSNFLSEFKLEYRMSQMDEWHTLKIFDSKLRINVPGADRYEREKNATTREYIKLPKLSSTYELSFNATYYNQDGTRDIFLERARIKNIIIDTEYNLKVSTGNVLQLKNNSAIVQVMALEGIQKCVQKGAEWTEDNSNWTKCDTKTDSVCLSNLPSGQTVFYRAFAVDEDGNEYKGDIKEMETTSFKEGDGTEESPYLISSAEEWYKLMEYIDKGNEFTNVYFNLNQTITLESNEQTSRTFNGSLNGLENWLILANGSFNYLFNCIGTEGLVKNLKIYCQHLSPVELLNSGICISNFGIISGCSIKIEEKMKCSFFTGFCATNYGWIVNCSSDFSAEADGFVPCLCGICWKNNGTISNCEALGEYESGSNGSMAGISLYNNDFSLTDATTSSGLISNCRNYVNFKMTGTNYSGPSIGGISAYGQGRIERCINYGTINAEFGTSYGYTFGSIAGQGWLEPGMDITDCLNFGESTIDCTEMGFPADYYKAGMVGYTFGGSMRNMINFGNIKYVKDSETKVYGDVIGTNNMSETYDCWAVTGAHDIWTQKVQSFASIVDSWNRDMGSEGYWTLDENGFPALREMLLDLHLTIGRINDFGSDYISVPWFGGGSKLSECKLQWRKVDDKKWKDVMGENNKVNKTIISGLIPKTQYEVRVVALSTNGDKVITETDTISTMFEPIGLDSEEFVVNDYDDLNAFAQMISHGKNFINKKIVLTHDIDMRGSEDKLWEPMRSKYSFNFFQGEFDGQGHILYDMKINTRKCYAGLFALASGYVHDITIRNAEIVCSPAPGIAAPNYSFSGSGNTGGVGGIIGSSVQSIKTTFNPDYENLIERCGFEGIIKGGNSIGGLVGNYGIKVIDSYAHATIHANESENNQSTYSISGISNMAGSNCYFAGQIISDNTLEWVDGVSAGVNGVHNSYYNKDALEGIQSIRIAYRGNPIESDKMKDESFVTILNPSNPEIWSIIKGINDDYPVLAECNKPRVTTESAICEEDGKITLRALAFDGGNGAYVEKGFQYFSNTTNQQVVFDVKAAKEAGIRFETHLENKDVPLIGINYRAYAVFANNDTISGDWEEFVPNVVLPRLDLIAVNYAEGKGHVSYTIEVGTENVAKFDLVTVTDKDERFVQDLDYKETRGTISLPSYDDFPLTTFIECTLSDGRTIVSDSIAWGPFGIEGDANVDFRLTVADVTTTLNYILDIYPRHFSKENTDVNKDGNITVTDATIITNMVMGATYKALPNYGDNTDGAQSNLTLQMDDLSFTNGVPTELGIRINEAENFVAAQFDIIVDDCIKIVDAIADSKHDVVWKHLSENRYRIMVYSMGNEHFATDNIAFLTFVADGGAKPGNIEFDHVFVDSVNGNEINEIMLKPSNTRYTTNNTTHVEELSIDKPQNGVYYNLKGQRILTPHKGVYIVNGKKVTL